MNFKELSVKEALKLTNAFFIDVREQFERDTAYIPASIHIPLKQIGSFSEAVPGPIVVYCASGCRSQEGAQKLAKRGYKNVYSLKGGITEWQKSGRKVFIGGKLSRNQLLRYARQITLRELGIKEQQKLLESKVLIVGAGGLGSPAALYLAGAGVGTIGIIDSDSVELDNLHRQILHTTGSIGEKKVKSAERTINNLNNDVIVKAFAKRLTSDNVSDVLKGFDIVLDGSDNFPTRYLVNEACIKLGVPLVHGSILRFTGQVSVFDPRHGGPCYACLYPEAPPPEVAPSCVEAGVLGVIPGIIGSMQALEALKLLAGFGEPCIGKLLIFDGLKLSMKTLEVKKDPKCRVCSLI